MKYPYIGGIDSDCKTLFLDECYGIAMEHSELEITGIPEYDWSEDEFKNITREYLQNTYGEVLSPEHAEFIIELAEWHGYDCEEFAYDGRGYFYTDESCLSFTTSFEVAGNDGEKQITIPLPPKADKQEVSEFPQVGDEVSLRYKFDSKQIMHTGKLLYLSDNHIIIATGKNGDYHCHRCDWNIEKPKTPEEELRDEMLSYIEGIYSVDSCAIHEIAKDLIKFHNITKKA